MRNRVLGLAGGVSAVILAFVVGTLMHGSEPSEKVAPNRTETAPVKLAQRSNVTLVPATEGMLAVPLEQPITTAPPQAPGQQPNDATALPSDQYAAAAAKAKAVKEAQMVDPRTVEGRAYEEPVEAPLPVAEKTADVAPPERTEAYPEYKPLPQIHVDRDTEAHLTLTVGADGRVKDVNISDPIPGQTAKLIDAVQNWRFRPATENGTPVSAKVAVTIILHGNE